VAAKPEPEAAPEPVAEEAQDTPPAAPDGDGAESASSEQTAEPTEAAAK
jgi:hypothetical protein